MCRAFAKLGKPGGGSIIAGDGALALYTARAGGCRARWKGDGDPPRWFQYALSSGGGPMELGCPPARLVLGLLCAVRALVSEEEARTPATLVIRACDSISMSACAGSEGRHGAHLMPSECAPLNVRSIELAAEARF